MQTQNFVLNGKKEKKILKIKCEQYISFPEAGKQFEQFNEEQSYASVVKRNTCNKATQTIDTIQSTQEIKQSTRENVRED